MKRRENLKSAGRRKRNDNEVPGPQQHPPLGSVDLNARTLHRMEVLAENSRKIREARLERSRDRTEEMDEEQRFHPSAQRARKSFWKENTPTSKEVVERIRTINRRKKRKRKKDPAARASIQDQRKQRKEAIKRSMN